MIPFPEFGCFSSSTRKKRNSRPDIVDVDYQEVKTSHESPGFDRKSREEQIIQEAFRNSAELMKKSPISAVTHSVIWIEGAKWADDHHRSEYPSENSWSSDSQEALNKLLQDNCPEALQDPVFKAVLFMSFSLGARWAESHPANG